MARGRAAAIVLDEEEKRELTALTRKHRAPQTIADWARIVLAAASGLKNKEIAEKVCATRGPAAVMVPLRGVSAIDREGQPFAWPEADAALFQSLRNWMGPQAERVELDLHINDPAFAEAAARKLLQMMGTRP